MRHSLIGACLATCITAVSASEAAAHSQFVRELDVYCVSGDGTREGVAASQDGATSYYVQRSGETPEILKSVHSRRTVSLWHAALDAAGFNAMEGPKLDAPHCAIERAQSGQVHYVRWREGEIPQSLAEVFVAIIGEDRTVLGANQ